MRKKYYLMAVLMLCTTILCACGTSDRSWFYVKSQGQKNAVEYFENKYGETPRILSAKVLWGTGYTSPGCLPDLSNIGPTGIMECLLECNGDYIDLRIDGDTTDYRGHDNYEEQKVYDAIRSDIEEELGISADGFYARFYDVGYVNQDNLLEVKFTNLPEFYSATHTVVYFATDEKIDVDKVRNLAEKYDLSGQKAFLRIYMAQYYNTDDINEYEYQSASFKFADDDDVAEYYDIYYGNLDFETNIFYNDEKLE